MADECFFKEDHHKWTVIDGHPLTPQRKIKQKTIDELLKLANMELSNYMKKKRNLKICDGCISVVQDCSYQNEFEAFATSIKRQKLESSGVESTIHYSSSESLGTDESLHGDIETNDDADWDFEADQNFDTGAEHGSERVDDIPVVNEASVQINLNHPDLHLHIKSLKDKDRVKLANAVAQSELQNIPRYVENNSQNFKGVKTLKCLDLKKYYDEQSPVLRAFLLGIQGQGVQSTRNLEKHLYTHCKAIESLLHVADAKFVQPLHFRESLVLYNITKSKTALQLMAAKSPYPSYTTILDWLRDLSLTPSVQRPLGDIIITIDNNQILKKKWAIRVENKSYSTVVTMIVAFELDKEGQLQCDPVLVPLTWRQKQIAEEDIKKIKQIGRNEMLRKIHFEEHLSPFVQSRLVKVASEQQFHNGQWVDCVDAKVEADKKQETVRICSYCQYENNKSVRKCQSCGANLTAKKENELTAPKKHVNFKESRVRITNDKMEGVKLFSEKCQERSEYIKFGCINADDNPKTYVLKPSMVNPNSYESIRTCLIDVGIQSGIWKYGNGERRFIFVYCDGVPYNLIQRVIWCTFRCTRCKQMLSSKAQCDQHTHNEEFECLLEFADWLLVFPGGGHIEMNMLRALVEMLWPICWRDMVLLFNFRSEAALRSAQKVADHHKGWTIGRIFRNATVDELLVPYVRYKLDAEGTTVELSSTQYWKYIGSAVDPNYKFMTDVAFELIDAIFMFRAGVRTGRTDFMKAGRALYAKMWVGRRHPQYRELEVQSLIQQIQLPDKLKEFENKSMSLNMTGVACTGESPDFRLEEVNKQVQSFMPLAPRASDWEKVCSNYDTLMDIKKSLLKDKGSSNCSSIWNPREPGGQDPEELVIRAMFRKVRYLSTPHEEREHISISGEKLNPELVKFVEIADKKFGEYVEAVVKHNQEVAYVKPAAVMCKTKEPILVTQHEVEEYSRLDKRTIQELEIMTEEEINKISDGFREEWKNLWDQGVKKKTNKSGYIDFLEEVKAFNMDVDSDGDTSNCEGEENGEN